MFDFLSRLSVRRSSAPLLVLLVLVGGLLTGTRLLGLPSQTTKAGQLYESPVPAAIRLAGDAGSSATPPTGGVLASALSGSPEGRLIAIYRLIADNQMDQAMEAARALTLASPQFKLAQLVYGDLLSSRAAPLQAFGGIEASSAADAQAHSSLSVLQQEAQLRIRALQERPPAGAIPSEFVLLPPSVKFAVAVDTSHARLYLFENGTTGLKLVNDFYVSVGKQGVDKQVEGDQKTPLGVYFMTDRIDRKSALLQDRFGVGAMPLNYPNAYDKLRGRTGGGILVHGVPSDTYSRPPQDSDGCVAMANADLQTLSRQLPQRDTPVLITRSLEWVVPNASTQPHPEFMKALHQWQEARLRRDRSALLSRYDASALKAEDAASNAKTLERLTSPLGGFGDLSVLAWNDQKDVLVVSFKELSPAGSRHDHLVHQYWGREGSQWKILAEGTVR